MVGRPVKIETIVERAIRSTLSDLATLEPAMRLPALKLGIDWVRLQHKLETDAGWGSEYRSPEDLTDE
jgi:hypothetical protein